MDRRGDEMIGITAPLPWVEAQDPPCKGAEENRKRATTSMLSDFRPQKPQESNTTARRNTPVIYFHKNRPTQNSQKKKLIKTSHTHHCFSQQITCQKQPKRGPGYSHPSPVCGSVSHELSTPQGDRASPRLLPQKTFEIPNGADIICKKKQRKIQ